MDQVGSPDLLAQSLNFETLTEQTGSKYGLLPGELRSGGRRREAVRARAEIALRAVRELGYSGADVARYLGVTTSCINRVVGAVRGREKGDGRGKIEDGRWKQRIRRWGKGEGSSRGKKREDRREK